MDPRPALEGDQRAALCARLQVGVCFVKQERANARICQQYYFASAYIRMTLCLTLLQRLYVLLWKLAQKHLLLLRSQKRHLWTAGVAHGQLA